VPEPAVPRAAGGAAAPPFFAVSERKLLVLSLLTLSLYQFYWFYLHWQAEKRTEHPRISPIGRSLLVYLFCYRLFRRISDRAEAHDLRALPAAALAIGWALTSLAGQVLPWCFLALFATGFFLLPVQRAANAVNAIEAPGHDPNDRFTPWNVLWVVVTLVTAVLSWLAMRTLDAQLGF
jgi:hypothetical protein